MSEKMKRVGVIITDELVARANATVIPRKQSQGCVISLALKEQFGLNAGTGLDLVYPDRLNHEEFYPLSTGLQNVRESFDNQVFSSSPVPTGVFPLDLPARLVSK